MSAIPGGVSYRDSVDVIAARHSGTSVSVPMVLHYHTEKGGWPAFVLTAMPDDMLIFMGLQRGRYAYETFATNKKAMDVMRRYGRSIEKSRRTGLSNAELAALFR